MSLSSFLLLYYLDSFVSSKHVFQRVSFLAFPRYVIYSWQTIHAIWVTYLKVRAMFDSFSNLITDVLK